MNKRRQSIVVLCLCVISSAQASEYFWPFSIGVNPALSETAFPNAATITPGPFSIGWVNHLPFSTNQGFWDLGSSGTVTATIADDSTKTVVETVEWYDGAIYGSFATVAIPGATFLNESFTIEEPWPVVGNWIKHRQEFSVSGSVWTMTVTGATNGTVLGSLHVSTFKANAVFALSVESSASPTGPWTSSQTLLLVTNQPGSLFYRVNIKSAP